MSLLTAIMVHYSDLPSSSSSSSSSAVKKEDKKNGVDDHEGVGVDDDDNDGCDVYLDKEQKDEKNNADLNDGNIEGRFNNKDGKKGKKGQHYSSSLLQLHTKHSSLLSSWLAHISSYEALSKKLLHVWLRLELSNDEGCEVGQLLAMKVLIASFAALIRLISINHMYQSHSSCVVVAFDGNRSSSSSSSSSSSVDAIGGSSSTHSPNIITIGDEIMLRTIHSIQTFLKINFLTTTNVTGSTYPSLSSSSSATIRGGSGTKGSKGKHHEQGIAAAMCEVVSYSFIFLSIYQSSIHSSTHAFYRFNCLRNNLFSCKYDDISFRPNIFSRL